MQNLTAMKHTHNGITKWSYKLEALGNLVKDGHGLLILDNSNKIIGANQTAGKLFGLTASHKLHGIFLSEIFSNPHDVHQLMANLNEQNSIHDQTAVFANFNGQSFKATCSTILLKDENLTKKLILIRSNGEELAKKLSDTTRQAEDLTEEYKKFTYIVTHDFNASIRAISNLSEWIFEEINRSLNEEELKKIELFRSRIHRMESMIKGLSEYAKIEKQEALPENTNVFDLLLDVINNLPSLPNMSIEIMSEMPVFKTNPKPLHKVFYNLIDNAIKYNNKEKGSIKIYAKNCLDHFEFTVEDNGPGIAPENHEKIFGVFHTLHSKDKIKSTGMGLTIAKKILLCQGGKIWLKSELGAGTQFIFSWPKI